MELELLAPAGNFECVKAAVSSGADAVYFGGTAFGARAYADNFNHEQIIETVRFCHLHNVKCYITFNTLISTNEFEAAMKEVDFYYHADVDALIVQDLGLIERIRAEYPDFELHASTQMHSSNAASVSFLQQAGLKRVVLARECDLKTIQAACATGCDIEVFVHGALCISYSGQCLMSSALQHRSGNKGVCAQCCRLQYDLFDETDQKKVAGLGQYLLSPKDLMTVTHLQQLVEAGVKSFKIEGRMKRPEYVAQVVSVYRKALDCIRQGKRAEITEAEIKKLKLMFHRGFTLGYAFHQRNEAIMNPLRPNHIGIEIGKVVKATQAEVSIALSETLNQHDGIRFINDNEDVGCKVTQLKIDGRYVSSGQKGQIVQIPIKEFVQVGAQVVKTTDIKLIEALNEAMRLPKFEVSMKCVAYVGEPLKCTLSDGTHTVTVSSEVAVQAALKQPMTAEAFETQFNKLNDTAYRLTHFEMEKDEAVFIPNKQINQCRRKAVEALNQKRSKFHERKGKQDYVIPSFTMKFEPELVVESLKPIESLPTFIEGQNSGYIAQKSSSDCGLIHQISDLMSNPNAWCSAHFNVTNPYALLFLARYGAKGVVLSTELSERQIEDCCNRFEAITGQKANMAIWKYGRRNLMQIKNNLVQTYHGNKTHQYSLVDQKKRHFPLFINQQEMIYLLEEKPFELAERNCSWYLRYTLENEDETGAHFNAQKERFFGIIKGL